jgi:hypothetical protein
MTNDETKTRQAKRSLMSKAFAFVSSFEFLHSSLIRGFGFRHSNFRPLQALIFLLPLAGVSGCIFYKTDPLAKKATDFEWGQEQPDYWWNRPATAKADCGDFDKLWNACKGELYVRLFPLDREQYREGLISSESVVSQQFFEPWRRDTATLGDLAESSLSTIRRTVRIEVSRQPDGSYIASPKVLVERWAFAERRLTSITQYHEAFSGSRVSADPDDPNASLLQAVYWYPVRRDTNLEKAMAESIQHAVGPTVVARAGK